MPSRRLKRWQTLANRKEMRPAWLVLLLSLLGTLYFWQLARDAEASARLMQLKAQTQTVLTEIERRMLSYRQVIRAGAGLFAANRSVTLEEWRAFLSKLELSELFPAALGIGYAAMVPPGQLEEHEAMLRAIYGEDYTIRPPGAREVYSAIVYLEPQNWRNARAIGFDMYSEPKRRSAMDRAVATERVALSGRVRLVQEEETDVQPGVLLYFPVFQPDSADGNAVRRIESVEGFVYTPLRLHDFMNKVMESIYSSTTEPPIRIELFDGNSTSSDTLLFDSAKFPSSSGISMQTSFELNGRVWTIRASSTPRFEELYSYRPELMLGVGLAINLLLFALAASMAAARIQDRQASAHMALLTRELGHRVKNTLAIVQSIANRSLVSGRSMSEGRDIFLKRLHALARAHTFLLNNAWSGADMRQLLLAELEVFGARATVHGPDVHLNPQQAQAITLVVHELATNALKHGALSGDHGRVDVSWAFAGRDRELVRFTWTESGGPAVEPSGEVGFGQILLTQSFAREGLPGPVLELKQGGLYYEAHIPVGQTDEIDPLGRE